MNEWVEILINEGHASKYTTNNSFSRLVMKCPSVHLFSPVKKLTIVKDLNHFSRLCLATSCQSFWFFSLGVKWPNVFFFLSQHGRNKSLRMLIILIFLPDHFSHCRLFWKYSFWYTLLRKQLADTGTLTSLRWRCYCVAWLRVVPRTCHRNSQINLNHSKFRISPTVVY